MYRGKNEALLMTSLSEVCWFYWSFVICVAILVPFKSRSQHNYNNPFCLKLMTKCNRWKRNGAIQGLSVYFMFKSNEPIPSHISNAYAHAHALNTHISHSNRTKSESSFLFFLRRIVYFLDFADSFESMCERRNHIPHSNIEN